MMHSVEGIIFASQVGCKLANKKMPTHFVESVMAFKPVCVLPRHSKRDIRGPSFHLHLSFSPPAGWVQLSLQGASFSTKCKPVRLKPPPMTMTMFLYRITNLQTSSEKHGKRSSCILLLGSRTSFFMALTVLYVHYAEDHLPKSNGRENKYITLHLSDLSLSGFYDVIRT